MRIGILSRRTGVSVRMLRYYEQEELLRPDRRPSGYRDYDETDVETVNHIRQLNEAGLKLDIIRRFLPCVTGSRPDFDPCPSLQAAFENEIDSLQEKIARLESSRDLLSGHLKRMMASRVRDAAE